MVNFLGAATFSLSGPAGKLIRCRWTASKRRHGVNEFQIVLEDDHPASGCLFGLYDCDTDRFVLLPAADYRTGTARTDIKVDLDWRGSRFDLREIGTGWYWDIWRKRLVMRTDAA